MGPRSRGRAAAHWAAGTALFWVFLLSSSPRSVCSFAPIRQRVVRSFPSSSSGRSPARSRVVGPLGALISTADTFKVDTWQGFHASDRELFLEEYWQKKPLLVRQAFPGFQSPISPDELAGISCTDDAESRIIRGPLSLQSGEDPEEHAPWTVEHGPFEEEMFSELVSGNWTLLVNEVNRHVPEVSDILQNFDFIPSWRIDDIMVSYAPPGGSVGPHVDSYDVFLLQGAGKRLWVLEGVVGRDDSTTFISAEEESQRLLEDIDVRVLGDFHTGPSFVLEPGDMLYLPPRIGHHGISMDKECMTYSIGCRAPSHRELITFFTDSLVNERIPAGAMLEDADLILQTNPGLISSGAIGKARSIIKDSLLQAMDDDAFFDKWFGEFISRSKRDHTDYPVPMDTEDVEAIERSPSAIVQAMHSAPDDAGPYLYRTEGLTFAYIKHASPDKGAGTLFIDGHSFRLGSHMLFAAAMLCSKVRLTPGDLKNHLSGSNAGELAQLLQKLLLAGYIYAADD